GWSLPRPRRGPGRAVRPPPSSARFHRGSSLALFQRNRDGSRQTSVHGEEVPVVGDEVTGGGLLIVRDDPRREQSTPVAVRDQGGRLRVDVERSRRDAAGACV